MTNNSANVASYLILNSLSSGSKYGLEIIENVSNRTGGHYLMKKPTLYSALTRMEKKGLVSSSYWQTSDMGGKRHYYTITNAGRKELEQLNVEFSNVSFDDFEEEQPETSSISQPNVQVDNNFQESESSHPVVGWQDSLFNMTSTKKEDPKVEETKPADTLENQFDMFSYQAEQVTEEPRKEEPRSSYNIFDVLKTQQTENKSQENSTNQEKMEYYQSILEQKPTYLEADTPLPEKDDAVFLADTDRLTNAQEQQNQRLYDNSSDLKRYRKRKSFAENQIEMSVDYETEEDREIQRERIQNLKNSLLNLKQNKNEQVWKKEDILPETKPFAPSSVSQNAFPQESIKSSTPENEEQERVDDAVFITSRYSENEIPVQKKITPPNIDIDVTDDNLPAPKRDTNLEPTYKDMMAKLFERKKEKEKLREENLKAQQEQKNTQKVSDSKSAAQHTSQNSTQSATQSAQSQPAAQTAQSSQKNYVSYESGNYNDMDSFVDYNTLQRYYAERGISFKEYKKTTVQSNHNTNFLQFISSIVLLALSGIGCAVLFGIIAGAKLLNPSSNFLFYTTPCLFLLYVLFTFIRYKLYASKKAGFTYNSVVNWAVFILSLVVIMVSNIICGMQYEIFWQFLTPLLVPAYAMFLAFPCNYYIKKFLYKRYAK